MRGVAEKRHPRHAFPPMPGRKRVQHARSERRLTIGDQCCELRRSTDKRRCHASLGRRWIREVDVLRRRSERRDDALSREWIVDAAIELLDDEGETGLTFHALAARLETGAGAIYWHIANKNELLVAATDAVVTRSRVRRRDRSHSRWNHSAPAAARATSTVMNRSPCSHAGHRFIIR